ncbi:MAG: hypothetical protein N3A65_00065 [candidate division WOR-3 bacterium]|nr:hypothetical protein [candidate division WOR-3 bacterium]
MTRRIKRPGRVKKRCHNFNQPPLLNTNQHSIEILYELFKKYLKYRIPKINTIIPLINHELTRTKGGDKRKKIKNQ